ncbi:hypothetical protein ACIRU2_03830 [Streptomyces sp. NPDC101169]|uniref:hypothetical protein n=1 Tax=Streptomyces sp. NPDC101169 TaxID=3366121 RepID=UPI0038003D29
MVEIAATAESLSGLAEPGLPAPLAVSLLEQAWDSLNEGQQQQVLDLVDQKLGSDPIEGEQYKDPDAALRLRELLAEPHEYLTLSLQQWRSRKSDLLADGKSTLVLFDRDFSREGAAADAGEGEIERLLSEAPEGWKIGLLTHTVDDADAEVAAWRALSEQFQAGSSRFLVIAKGRLAEVPDTFPRMLKLTLLAPALEQIQHKVYEAVQEVWHQANEDALAIDPYTLEAALSGDRVRDGAWGPETLLRVTGAFTQDKIRAKLRGNMAVHEASALIASLGQIMPASSDGEQVRKELARIERLEYYDSPEHVNELCFPIEAGDIFMLEDFVDAPGEFEKAEASLGAPTGGRPARTVRTKGVQYLVLLAQPCDLAIRANGRRSNDLTYARMAPLRLLTDRVVSQPGGVSAASFDLPFFDSDTGAGVEARLSQQQIVPLTALDMCAFNSDGEAVFHLGEAAPDLLLPNWKKRYRSVEKWVRSVVTQYKEMEPHNIPAKGADALTRALTCTGVCPSLQSLISVREGAVHYGIRRLTRLREPYRSALLTRMAQRESRDAFDPSLLDKQARS